MSKTISADTADRLQAMSDALNQALQLFGSVDMASLPVDIQQAIALVSSATTHATHIVEHQDLP